MAFTEPTEKKARLEKIHSGALGNDILSNVQRNQQNSHVEADLRHLIEFNSANNAVLQAVLADEYTRDFQTGSHLSSLPFACYYLRLFLLIKCSLLIFSVQVYAAEIRDKTQTSELIRYASNKVQMISP